MLFCGHREETTVSEKGQVRLRKTHDHGSGLVRRGFAACLVMSITLIRSRNHVGVPLCCLGCTPFPIPISTPCFAFGPLQFRWYGLMYLIGLTLAYFIIGARAKAQRLPLDKDHVYDMIVYAAVGVFAGGRLGYVLFITSPIIWRIPQDPGRMGRRHVVPRRIDPGRSSH